MIKADDFLPSTLNQKFPPAGQPTLIPPHDPRTNHLDKIERRLERMERLIERLEKLVAKE